MALSDLDYPIELDVRLYREVIDPSSPSIIHAKKRLHGSALTGYPAQRPMRYLYHVYIMGFAVNITS